MSDKVNAAGAAAASAVGSASSMTAADAAAAALRAANLRDTFGVPKNAYEFQRHLLSLKTAEVQKVGDYLAACVKPKMLLEMFKRTAIEPDELSLVVRGLAAVPLAEAKEGKPASSEEEEGKEEEGTMTAARKMTFLSALSKTMTAKRHWWHKHQLARRKRSLRLESLSNCRKTCMNVRRPIVVELGLLSDN